MQWVILGVSIFFTTFGLFLLWHLPPFNTKTYLGTKKVSVIIPARNEAKRIRPLLSSLQKQQQYLLEWIVVDDQSSDGTADIARKAGAKVITTPPLPKGWFGKPWACYQGAKAAQGDIYLFLDADTILLPQGLEKILSEFAKKEVPLSIQPYHYMIKFYEQFSLFFNLIVMMSTALFTPFGKRFEAEVFFGPCQIMLAEDYWRVDGHAAGKHAILEDIALGQALVKKTGKPLVAKGGKGVIAFRMYPGGIKDLVEGWTKNFASGAGLIPGWLLMLISGWITGMFIAVLSGFAPFMWQDQAYLIGYLITGILTWILGRKVGNFSILTILLFPLYLFFFVGLFIRSTIRSKAKKQVTWKGRNLDL